VSTARSSGNAATRACGGASAAAARPGGAIQQAKLNDFLQWARILPKRSFT